MPVCRRPRIAHAKSLRKRVKLAHAKLPGRRARITRARLLRERVQAIRAAKIQYTIAIRAANEYLVKADFPGKALYKALEAARTKSSKLSAAARKDNNAASIAARLEVATKNAEQLIAAELEVAAQNAALNRAAELAGERLRAVANLEYKEWCIPYYKVHTPLAHKMHAHAV